MDFKNLFFFGISLLCFYILYRLVVKRQILLEHKQKHEQDKLLESFTSPTKMTPAKNTSLPLNQYVIKSSFNTALNNAMQIDLGMVMKVLQKGCRYLDFEIYSIDNKPTLGYSSSRDFNSIETGQKIVFDDLCKKLSSSAFTSPVPNGSDPLFINLRIKTTNYSLLDKMAISIEDNLGSRVYKTQVTQDTLLSELVNKIIFIVDVNYMRDYAANSCLNISPCHFFSSFISLESGNSSGLNTIEDSLLLSSLKTPLSLSDSGKTAVVKKWLSVSPGFGMNASDSNLTSFLKLVKHYGAHIVLFKFYQDDDGLQTYENFFSDNGETAFVPLTVAYTYLQNLDM